MILIISQTQWNLKKEELIQASLKRGIIPNTYEITQSLNDYFNNQSPGLPLFKPVHQTYHGLSSAVLYNQNFKSLGTDLEVAYRANQSNNDKLLEIEENYRIETDRLQQRLKRLRLRLASLNEALEQDGFCGSINEVFHHFHQVEFEGNADRNLPETSCFVNLAEHQCELEQRSSTVEKHDLSTEMITLSALTPISSSSFKGPLTALLKDTLNETSEWLFHSSQSAAQTLQLNLVFPASITANTFKLHFFANGVLNGSLTLYDEEGESETLYDMADEHLLSWHFEDRAIKSLDLVLTKSEPDALQETGAYDYYYLFKSLSLSTERYLSEGQYVTKPFLFQKIPTALSLSAEDYTFPKTQLYYYLALDNGENILNWELIEKGQPFQFDILEEKALRIHRLSEGFHQETVKKEEEVAVYSVFKLPPLHVEDSIQLVGGYQKWKMDVIDLSQSPFSETLDLHQLDLDAVLNHETVPSPTRIFSGCDNYTWDFPSASLVICEQYIRMDQDLTKVDLFINQTKYQMLKNVGVTYRVFLNGIEIKTVQDRLNLRLKKGKNRLQFIFHVPKQGEKIKTVTLLHNLNFKDCSQMIYAIPPLKRVDFYTLSHLSSLNDEYAYYAILDGTLYVKHNPHRLEYEGLSERYDASGTPYFIRFQQVKPESAHLLMPYGNGYQLQLRLMAILKTERLALSPRIKSFRFVAH